MIKGAQKKMIVVKTEESSIFEEAYFVVRRQAEKTHMDMLEEANKIIEDCRCEKSRKEKGRGFIRLRDIFMLCCGAVIGGGGAVLVMYFCF